MQHLYFLRINGKRINMKIQILSLLILAASCTGALHAAETKRPAQQAIAELMNAPVDGKIFISKLKNILEQLPDDDARYEALKPHLAPAPQIAFLRSRLIRFALQELAHQNPQSPLYPLLLQYIPPVIRQPLPQNKMALSPAMLRLHAAVAIRQDRLKDAQNFLQTAWKRKKELETFRLLAAWELLYAKETELEKLIAESRECLRSPEAKLARAALFLRMKRPQEALKELEEETSGDAAFLRGIALFCLERNEEAFDTLDKGGQLQIDRFKGSFSEQFFYNILFQTVRRESSGTWTVGKDNLYQLYRNNLENVYNFNRENLNIVLAALVQSPDRAKICRILKRNGWLEPELFLFPQNTSENFRKLREKLLKSEELSRGETLFMFMCRKVPLPLDKKELLFLAEQCLRKKIVSSELLKYWYSASELPADEKEKRIFKYFSEEKTLESLQAFISDPVLTPVFYRILKNRERTLPEETLFRNVQSYLIGAAQTPEQFTELLRDRLNDPQRLMFITSPGWYIGFNVNSLFDAVSCLRQTGGSHILPSALAGFGSTNGFDYYMDKRKGNKMEELLSKSATFDLPPLLKIYFLLRIDDERAAREIMKTVKPVTPEERLNLAAFAFILHDYAAVNSLAEAVFSDKTLPLIYRQLAATQLIRIQTAFRTQSPKWKEAVEFLLTTAPELRTSILIELREQRPYAESLRKRFPPVAKTPALNTLLNTDRKAALESVLRELENAEPLINTRGVYRDILFSPYSEEYQVLKELLPELKKAIKNPRVLAVVCEIAEDYKTALQLYRKIHAEDPHDQLVAAKICALGEPEPELIKQLIHARYFIRETLFQGNPKKYLRLVEMIVDSGEDLDQAWCFRLLAMLDLYARSNNEPTFVSRESEYSYTPSGPSQKHRLELCIKIIRRGQKNPGFLLTPPVFNFARFAGAEFPQDLRETMIQTYTPDKRSAASLGFFITEYLRNPEKMRPILCEKGMKDELSRREALLALPPAEFNAAMPESAKAVDNQEFLNAFSDYTLLARHRNLHAPLRQLWKHYSVYTASTAALASYLTLYSDRELLEQFLSLQKEVQKNMQNSGEFYSSSSYTFFKTVREAFEKRTRKSEKLAAELLHQYALGNLNAWFLIGNVLLIRDPFAALENTPFFGTMQNCVTPDLQFISVLHPETKKRLKNSIQTRKKTKQNVTFGMEAVNAALESSRKALNFEQVMRERSAEWEALPRKRKLELLNQLSPILRHTNFSIFASEQLDELAEPEPAPENFASRLEALRRRTGRRPENAPGSYLSLLKKGLGFKERISKEKFQKTLAPLADELLDIFPILDEKQERALLPYLLEYFLFINDQKSLDILREYTDIVTPEYRAEVKKSCTKPAAEAFRTVFPEVKK